MKIVTYNVNGIKARLPRLLEYLEEQQPDVVCLQELKAPDEAFPHEEIAKLGYAASWHGQKSFNGVAILSRLPLEDVVAGLPGDDEDEQARLIEATVIGDKAVRVVGIYLPNGNPAPGPKYDYKLAWMARLRARAMALLEAEEPFVIAGDYNVIPAAADARNIATWEGDALYLPHTRGKFRALTNLGLTDAVRAGSDSPGLYTFWDYQAGAWQKNNGIRIDHALLSPQAADRLKRVEIHKDQRAKDKPSDHVPFEVELAL